MEQDLKQVFFDKYSALGEQGKFDRLQIELGKYRGDDMLIVESWEDLAILTALFNGYTGELYPFTNLFRNEDPEAELDKAKKQLEVLTKETPVPNGRHYTLESRIRALQNVISYRAWLEVNDKDLSIEDFGIEVGFSDEYCMCRDCYSTIVRTSPDSYSWTPPLETDEGYVCDDCAPNYSEYILEEFCNVQKSIPDQFDVKDLGLVKVNDSSYQNGFHNGMDDSPEPIIKKFNDKDIDVWFKVYPSQFYLEFDVYVKEENELAARDLLNNINPYQGYSTSGNLAKGLKQASLDLASLNGDGIKYASISSDGSVTAKIIDPDTFVKKGIKE
jgi:hypothetical protein